MSTMIAKMTNRRTQAHKANVRYYRDHGKSRSTLCREGITKERTVDALLPLAHLSATRHPGALAAALPTSKHSKRPAGSMIA